MATTPRVQTLDPLFEYLDNLTTRASLADLMPRLEALQITLDDVAPFVRFGSDCYQRNLMRAGEHYHALILCWRSGQRSPIHNHRGSICGVRVLAGIATETIFKPSPCGQLKAISSRDLPTGGVCVSQDSDTHQVSNLQRAGDDLVTMHIYSPPLLVMDTFSISGAHVAEFRPVVVDQHDGSGI